MPLPLRAAFIRRPTTQGLVSYGRSDGTRTRLAIGCLVRFPHTVRDFCFGRILRACGAATAHAHAPRGTAGAWVVAPRNAMMIISEPTDAEHASSPTVAYLSAFTRAWELAIGALIAVSTKWLLAIPRGVAASLTRAGVGALAERVKTVDR